MKRTLVEVVLVLLALTTTTGGRVEFVTQTAEEASTAALLLLFTGLAVGALVAASPAHELVELIHCGGCALNWV